MQLGRISFYILSAAFILGVTVVAPLSISQRLEIDSTNAKLEELKAVRGSEYLDPNDTAVRQILDEGTKYFNAVYVQYSSALALLTCLVVLGMAYFIRIGRSLDAISVLVIFTALFLFGAIKVEFFGLIAVLCIFAFIVLRKRKIGSG